MFVFSIFIVLLLSEGWISCSGKEKENNGMIQVGQCDSSPNGACVEPQYVWVTRSKQFFKC